eukprot:6358188-Amphidinium_carterae.1
MCTWLLTQGCTPAISLIHPTIQTIEGRKKAEQTIGGKGLTLNVKRVGNVKPTTVETKPKAYPPIDAERPHELCELSFNLCSLFR